MSNNFVLWSLAAATVSILAAIIPMMAKDSTQHPSSAKQQQLLVTAGGFAVGFLLFWLYHQRRSGGGDNSSQDSGTGSSSTTPNANKSAAIPKPKTGSLKNVWQVGKSKGGVQKNKNSHGANDKPFGSKYYYAHNNPNATGGYKDGLKMEDYRMNGPRLLSKNGSSVDDDTENDVEDTAAEDQNVAMQNENSSTASATQNTKLSTHDANVRNITKYLWDDPGDTNGIATIRIDVLPDKRPGEYINWKDVTPKEVKASLAGEGLLVHITLADDNAADDNVKYQLKIPKLYGDAADVKCIVKSKRVLVKIHKKKNSFLSMNKNTNNLDAWPQPHRKI